jgi:hypothetical protein
MRTSHMTSTRDTSAGVEQDALLDQGNGVLRVNSLMNDMRCIRTTLSTPLIADRSKRVTFAGLRNAIRFV